MEDKSPRVIYFDGVCGLCNTFVDWVIKRDRRNLFLFAPIQGETGAARLAPLPENTDEWSIIYCNAAGDYSRASDAVLNILRDLGGFWRVLSWFKIVPRDIRDWIYAGVAKRRYRWFKKREQCRLPSPEERAKFLP